MQQSGEGQCVSVIFNCILFVLIHYTLPLSLAERGEGHDSQNEPPEDKLCHSQHRPLDRQALLQPPGGKPGLQGDEEDGEDPELNPAVLRVGLVDAVRLSQIFPATVGAKSFHKESEAPLMGFGLCFSEVTFELQFIKYTGHHLIRHRGWNLKNTSLPKSKECCIFFQSKTFQEVLRNGANLVIIFQKLKKQVVSGEKGIFPLNPSAIYPSIQILFPCDLGYLSTPNDYELEVD